MPLPPCRVGCVRPFRLLHSFFTFAGGRLDRHHHFACRRIRPLVVCLSPPPAGGWRALSTRAQSTSNRRARHLGRPTYSRRQPHRSSRSTRLCHRAGPALANGSAPSRRPRPACRDFRSRRRENRHAIPYAPHRCCCRPRSRYARR